MWTVVVKEMLRWRAEHAFGFMPLAELYRVAYEAGGFSLGEFHDSIRQFVSEKLLRLHPFTGAAYQIPQKDEACWLVSGQEMKAYVEMIDE
jgi:hypothetical protein